MHFFHFGSGFTVPPIPVETDARGESDHELVVCKIRLKLRACHSTTQQRRIDSEQLAHNKQIATHFQRSLNEHLPPLPDEKSDETVDLETMWESFKDAVIISATDQQDSFVVVPPHG